ncbi:LexA family transcriptional regulator [Sinomicrobium weinanense]|uniref:Helix-turn-helix domain-containing protein n=1 Tax=Sinomicrobium weinanense TaxID=2842200 RepID=A0A926JU99_9FLAO|nr:helix-turn-helix domain-containing protein [Sinomicrobium weinanense]MBC9797600.1 helix-turn-helix domain-containing protein [Sinomicrobium weinanense]MBU3123422.1 phage repressor protein CI [Sinomicrobium weinanense]
MLNISKYREHYANTQEKKSLNATFVLEKLKKYLQVKTNIELASILQVKPNTISTWKKRNSLDYELIVTVCEKFDIDLNDLFFDSYNGNDMEEIDRDRNIHLVTRELQYQYVNHLGEESFLNDVPKYHFPFINNDNMRAFQVTGNMMYPTLEDNAIVIGKHLRSPQEITNNKNYVIVSKLRGIFINRVRTSYNSPDELLLVNDNKMIPQEIKIHTDEIAEIWEVRAKLSYSFIEEPVA